jgi:hypothetical protein
MQEVWLLSKWQAGSVYIAFTAAVQLGPQAMDNTHLLER